jgi:hypothetical protein
MPWHTVAALRQPVARASCSAEHGKPATQLSQYLLPIAAKCSCVQSIESKDPFAQYGSLSGVAVHYGSPADPSTFPEGDFDIVYDNNGKSMEECQPLIDTYASKVQLRLHS